MSTQTPQEKIKKLREDFAAKQKEAEDALKQQIAEALKNVTESFQKSLETAQKSLEGLDDSQQEAVLDDKTVKKILASFGYTKRVVSDVVTAGDTSGGTVKIRSGGKFNKYKDAILAELKNGEKEQTHLMEKFPDISGATWGAWVKKYEALNLAKIRKDGTKNFWSKV